jgi:amino acid transporter
LSQTGGSEQSTVFLRRASGVVRAMSPADGMYYGYLAAAGLYGVVLFLFLGGAAFPNANFFAATLIGLVFFFPIYFVYSSLASAMPRSGGDYVFTSRLTFPSVAFSIAQAGWVFWQFWFAFLAASVIVNAVIAPMLSAIGVATGSHGWISAADTVQKWYVRVPIEVVLVVGAGVIMTLGMRYFLRLQRWFMMPGSIIGLLIIGASFLFVSKGTFLAHFDHFQRDVGGLSSAQIVSRAKALGFAREHSTVYDTFAMSVNLSFLYVWTIWTSELLGELKSATRMKSTFAMFSGAGILTFITFAVGIAASYAYAGGEFLRSFSWLVLNHPDELGGSWDFRGVPTFFYLPTLNLAVGIILFLCFLGPISQSLFNTQLSASRLLLAMSFDRVLPAWVGRVNRRGVPYVAIWLCVVISVALAILVELVPDLTKLLFWSSWATLLAILLTTIAAIVFPWRHGGAIFAASPTAVYRVAGVPLVAVCGVVGAAFLVASLVVALVHPGFGLLESGAARVGLITMIVLLAGSFVAFFGIQRYRQRQGIELSYAFKSIPPE